MVPVQVIVHAPILDAPALVEQVQGSSREVRVVSARADVVAAATERPTALVVVGWSPADEPAEPLVRALAELPQGPLVVLVHRSADGAPDPALREAGVAAVVPVDAPARGALASGVDALVDTWQLRTRLAQSEAQYTELLENTRDPIYILGPSRFTFVNRAFEELMGFAAEEICSPAFDYMRLIAPESRPMILERARLAATGETLPPRYEFMALNKAGMRLDVSVSVSYIVFRGQASSLGVLQDITARKQYEKALLRRNRELAVLNDLSATVSRATDVNTVLEVAVERLVAVMGFNAAGIWLRDESGEKARLRLARGIGETDEARMVTVPVTQGVVGAAIRTGDVQVVHDTSSGDAPARSEVSALGFRAAVCVPIQARDRVLGCALGLCTDAREFAAEELSLLLSIGHQLGTAVERATLNDAREAALERLEEAYKELKAAKDRLVLQEKLGALGEMAAGVAHDFNNMLGAILGRTQLLKTFVHDPTVQKSLEVIEKAALDGAATVRRIQEFSRAGGDEEFTPVILDSIAEDAAELGASRWRDRTRAEGRPVDLVLDLHSPPAVQGNDQQLREVLTNLVHNACDAMPQGGRITVATGMRDGRCFISVADTGTGIPPEVRSRVFDPFFTTKGVKGTGLGLSVSYGIVQRHKGDFLLDTEVGRGTTFTILLDPVPEAPSPLPGRGPAAAVDSTAPPRTGARVLIVDDEENIRDVLAEMLRAADHHVEVAVDGASALARLDDLVAQGLDVVFTDLGMPGMSGWELATEVRRRHPRLPVGLITGWGAQLDPAQMKNAGVDLVVPKPFRFDQVTSVVTEAQALARSRRAGA